MDSQPENNKDWVNVQREPDFLVPKGCVPDTTDGPGVVPADREHSITADYMDAGLIAPRLSLLLPTVTNRAALFALLHAEILRQCEGRAVEVIVACDAKEISIGKKRQNLLEQATGDYVAYVDDDDWLAPDYVDQILAALATSPDCVGFLISCTTNGGRPVLAKASMKYKRWGENEDGYRHTRSPYQKTPVRRDIALKAGFPDLRYGEDRVYSAALVKLVKTEVFVNVVLYHYRFSTETFHAKYGITPGAKVPGTGSGGKQPRLDYKGRRVGWL